jgi:alkylation response protein AidB-like acyl-CoA dehydrogenase
MTRIDRVPGVDLTLTKSEAEFQAEVRKWLEENHPGPSPEGDDDAEFAFRREWQRKMHEAGWAGISWPEEYGGKGATLIEQAIFNEELGRQRVPRPANVLGLVMGGPVVIAHGREEQKERYLDPILSGEEIWCQGFSEPESGSDLASLKTRAVKSNGTWKVTGQKVWTTYAHEAKWCMLLARTDQDAPKHKGITYFLLDMDQPNVDVRPLRQITGEAEFNEIFMEEAEIPDENIIGEVGGGWNVAITTLMFERAGLGAAAVMGLKRSLEDLIELIKEKGLEGDPILRQKVAELQTGIEAMRLGGLRALTATMKTGIPGPEGSLGKWQWAKYNQALTELGSEVAGPDGITVGTDWSYRFLRSRANSIEGGTTEVLQNIIAERVLGLPRLR